VVAVGQRVGEHRRRSCPLYGRLASRATAAAKARAAPPLAARTEDRAAARAAARAFQRRPRRGQQRSLPRGNDDRRAVTAREPRDVAPERGKLERGAPGAAAPLQRPLA
jgi:hypothetical protein